jgi:SAM-dependent methyltransferase
MYHPYDEVAALETHGQSWEGDSIEDNFGLCAHQLIEPVFRKYLPREGKILEAGCGMGRWVFYLRNLGYNIIGIDLAVDALKAAKEYDPNAPIYSDDVLHSSFPDKSFDAVISLGVVEHFEEGPQAALAEAARLLQDEGLLFVSVPIQNLNRVLFANKMKGFKRWMRQRRGARYAFEEYRYSRREFEALLDESDFKIIEAVPDDFPPPQSIGLYVDFPFVRDRAKKWKLNAAGRFLASVYKFISPWASSGGALWVCKKKSTVA